MNDLFEYLLRLGDDRLILGHRLSEWCGHGPVLEEDIALTNIALDLIGQANLFLGLAGEVEGAGRDADALAFLRTDVEFRNLQLTEIPCGDFGFTVARQFLFDAYSWHLLGALTSSQHDGLAGLAARSRKEVTYHLRHSSEWVLRLGDGTEESHRRVQDAFDAAWRYTGELFLPDAVDTNLLAQGIGADLPALKPIWDEMVTDVLGRATLDVPDVTPTAMNSRSGSHTEHLGHLLSEMQFLARSNPGAKW